MESGLDSVITIKRASNILYSLQISPNLSADYPVSALTPMRRQRILSRQASAAQNKLLQKIVNFFPPFADKYDFFPLSSF